MNKITIIKSENPPKVCKEYSKDSEGKIIKSVVANVTKGIGASKDADTAQDMAKLLHLVTSRDDLVLCAGLWHDDTGKKFEVLPEHELATLLGSEIGKVSGGVIEHCGRLISARLKRGITPSSWVLLDADNPVGIPDEWAAMTIAQRLELWEQLLPGISSCERIELRGSSARVINGSGSQKATHAWIRVSDPDKISLMKAYLTVEMVNKGISFQYKKHSRIDPDRVVGIESRSVFDLAVFDTGRLVFTARPNVTIPNYSVDDAGITIINEGAGPLDISWVKRPTVELVRYRELTGINMNVNISDDGYLSISNSGQLTLETEICSKGVIKPLSEWVATLKPGAKIRCESPFRESASEAAFIKVGDDGFPFVHDVGNGTTYQLKKNQVLITQLNPNEVVIDTQTMSVNKQGLVIANMSNLSSAIAQMGVRYDQFLESPFIGLGRFSDADYVNIAIALERNGFATISMGNLKEATRKVFKDNTFDSAIDWANALPVWDGVERVPTLLSHYFGVEASPYETACSMYIATAMAGRLLSPGVQADMVPVLIGAQGVGKTRSVMALAPLADTYAEIDLGNTRDSDMGRQLRGKLICELGELKGLKSRDSEWIKSWITRSHEEWVPKYVEYATIMPRRCVFIGTSNEQEFLVDTTGNRRWLPLYVVNKAKPELIRQDRDQIWAEAIHYFKMIGVAWQVAQELATDRHAEHMVKDDAMIEELKKYFDAPIYANRQYHKMNEVCQFIGLGLVPPRKDQLRVGEALRYMGYTRAQRRVTDCENPIKVWVKE